MSLETMMQHMSESFAAEKTALISHFNNATNASINASAQANFLQSKVNALCTFIKSVDVVLPDHLSGFVDATMAAIQTAVAGNPAATAATPETNLMGNESSAADVGSSSPATTPDVSPSTTAPATDAAAV